MSSDALSSKTSDQARFRLTASTTDWRNPLSSTSLGRRRLLITGIGAAVAGVGLSSCSSQAGNNNETDTSRTDLPTYVPYSKVTPDLHGTEQGVLDAFLSYPSPPIAATTEKPGSGGTVSALLQINTIPPTVDRNPYWQEINNRLGVDLTIRGVPATNYAQKLATELAGGDLPDFVQFIKTPHLADVLRSQFQDLSEHLSGDSVKDYPFLAAIPTSAWKNVMFNGGIYAIPYPQGLMSNLLFIRKDIRDELGLAHYPVDNAEDFVALCRALTDTSKNRWASGSPYGVLAFVQQMLEVPNVWKEEDGRFTSYYEVPETEKALDVVAGMWRDGLLHPDSFSGASGSTNWFTAGTTTTLWAAYSTWGGFEGPKNPQLKVDVILPPKFNGGGLGGKWNNTGIFTFTAIKKSSKTRTEELLRIANWLTTPFGTEEQLLRKYGIEGTHFTYTDGEPILTEKGTTDLKVPLAYIAREPQYLYEPGRPELTKTEYEAQQRGITVGVSIPTVGLISDTDISQGAQLDKSMKDLQADIIQGRKPATAWKNATKEWRSRGGDKIRSEFEESFAASNQN